ncbi:MAG: Ni/Fe-hydrogenase cytochrome b subunit [Desulfobacca sp.]|uniref:Ni/Fe-hydrogenase cytochrome b subunit n=1 Tax=Desulfobacca sp. TaxID=2067990 RepID=UPI004049D78F
MVESQPLEGKILTKPFLVLAALALVGFVLIVYRYVFGLGAVTNLSDGYPWGIWITYDVLVGTALGCGGYAMALLVYAFNRWEYHPLVRSAVLTSVFGYTLAGVAVFLDIGRYWNGYNLFFPWRVNFNSVLVEVALCIAAYVVVLWLELAPALLEVRPGPRAQRLRRRLETLLPIIVSLGILLPTMHQSSLGALMIIAGPKLSPLWQTPLLPMLFLITAIAMGYAVTVFESLLSSLAFGRPYETPLLARISNVMVGFVGIYLVIRLADVVLRGQAGLIFTDKLTSVMFIIENLLFLQAVIILARPANRSDNRWLFISAILLLLGGAVYRFNAFLVGYDPGFGWRYFPALPEIFITLGIVALELLGYLYFVKRYPILPKAEHA